MIIFLKKPHIHIYVLFETRLVIFSRKKNEFPLRKDVFTKFSLNWLSGSGEGRFLKKNHQSIVPNLL